MHFGCLSCILWPLYSMSLAITANLRVKIEPELKACHHPNGVRYVLRVPLFEDDWVSGRIRDRRWVLLIWTVPTRI